MTKQYGAKAPRRCPQGNSDKSNLSHCDGQLLVLEDGLDDRRMVLLRTIYSNLTKHRGYLGEASKVEAPDTYSGEYRHGRR